VSILHLISVGLMLVGAVFFLSGTIGILRFPDVFTRLHAVTKADNLGLGFICFGLALLASGPFAALKLLLIWFLALLAASFSCHLIARASLREADRRGDVQ
jgi:multicomponent Na+:H+ antiporter subunit G